MKNGNYYLPPIFNKINFIFILRILKTNNCKHLKILLNVYIFLFYLQENQNISTTFELFICIRNVQSILYIIFFL